jgi:hypothetical protein
MIIKKRKYKPRKYPSKYKGVQHHSFTHGESHTPLYKAWASMMRRCYQLKPTDPNYKYYILKGITVIEQWHKYENFKADVADSFREGLTLDRIDSSKGYCKENCRWSTMRVQNNNSSQNRFIAFEGVTKTHAQWADFLGINDKKLFCSRLSRGWSLVRAATKLPYRRPGINI